jgi:biopolymer transport protein ExbB
MFLINSILLNVDSAQAVEQIKEKESFLELAINGGWVMIVLLCLLALAIYISIERFLALNHALKDDSSQFMNEIRGYVHNGDVDGAKKLANSTDTAIGRMIAKGLSRLGRPLSDIQTAVENEGKMEVAKLEKHVSLVATVASLGPMLGFLGTVTGMVSAFQAMAHAGNNIDISNLAGGIYQAMVTTVGGLIVGIIAYFLYNLLVNRINKVVMQLESRSMEFMDLLHEPA